MRLVLAALTTLVAVAGCNIVAPIAYIIEGAPDVEPQYVLADVKTVVFVDDRDSIIPLSSQQMRQIIAERVTRDLLDKEIVLQMIDPRDAQGLALRSDRHGKPLSLAAIGEGVGAEQLIYIEMRIFTETPDGVTPRPTANCEVKVLDLIEGRRVFPMSAGSEQGAPVEATLPAVDPLQFSSSAFRLQVHRELANELGETVAKLFYKHEAYDLGDRLGG